MSVPPIANLGLTATELANALRQVFSDEVTRRLVLCAVALEEVRTNQLIGLKLESLEVNHRIDGTLIDHAIGVDVRGRTAEEGLRLIAKELFRSGAVREQWTAIEPNQHHLRQTLLVAGRKR